MLYHTTNRSIIKNGGGGTLKGLDYQRFAGNAFTLSEVLITLGIIGVVAAMTIPTVISNTRAAQYSSRYKKIIATLSNAGRMSLANYGFDYAGLNGRCNANSAADNPEEKMTLCALLNGTLSGATYHYGMNNLKMSNGQAYNPNSPYLNKSSMRDYSRNPTYILPDGGIIIFSSWVGMYACTGSSAYGASYIDNGHRNGCYGIIDVNGVSPPNKEVTCTIGNNVSGRTPNSRAYNCIVHKKDITDIYPFVLHDGVAEPDSDAAIYVLRNIH